MKVATKVEEDKVTELSHVGKNWDAEDMKLLSTAMGKFSVGTVNRWKVIADFVVKNMKETIAKAKEIAASQEAEVVSRRRPGC